MAEQEVQQEAQQAEGQCRVVLEQNDFWCGVCLDLLRVPVTIQCGHTYCWSCIEGCWDLEQPRGRYSCPQCRATFQPRPALRKNHILAEVVERLKKTIARPTPPPPAPASASSSGIMCDFCCGPQPNEAAKSCLTCLASYCSFHLEPHCHVPVLRTHQLVSAVTPLQEKMCTRHNRLMDVYCQTDETCICCLCAVHTHKGHAVVSAVAQREKEQVSLVFSHNKIKRRFQEREAERAELLQALTDFKSCSQNVLTSTEKLFNDMISSIQQKQTLTKQLIEAQESAAVARAEELQQLLDDHLADLSQRAAELEQLSRTNDHIYFIQTFRSLSTSCESPDLPPGAVVRPRRSLTPVMDSVTKLRANMENLLCNTWSSITAAVATAAVVLPPVLKTREDYLRYSCSVTLDVLSANLHLSVSQEGRRVTCDYNRRCDCTHSEDRFTHIKQVLCKEGLSERSYWEVSLSGHTWSVAVAYKDVIRASFQSAFGKNDKSWSLECSQDGYTFRHNAESQPVSGPKCSRIGVFLDYKAGTLTYFSISEQMTVLHREYTSFTRPLHPGLQLKETGCGSSSRPYAELLKLC